MKSLGIPCHQAAGREAQRLVRLLIERIIVQGEDVTIEHAVPPLRPFYGFAS